MRPSRQPIMSPNSTHCVPSKRISCICFTGKKSVGLVLILIPAATSAAVSPACRAGAGNEENWKLVLFPRHLPHPTLEEIRLMEEVKGAAGDA